MPPASLRTPGCTASRPCSKCRAASIHTAHAIVRYDSRGTRRSPSSVEPAHYKGRRGGYWQR